MVVMTYNGKGGSTETGSKVSGGTVLHEAITENETLEKIVSIGQSALL